MKQMLLKTKVALALGVIAIFLTATAFARGGPQDFILHNQTGVEIDSLYVSPHSVNDWEEDILGHDTLAIGESLKITFNDRDHQVHWDLKSTDKYGKSLERDTRNIFILSESMMP